MTDIKYQIVIPEDNDNIELIAGWYLREWKIPTQRTIEKIKSLSADSKQFQVLMTLDNMPVATGGLYNYVGLLDREPKFRIYKNWLALVYTTPQKQKKRLRYVNLQQHSRPFKKTWNKGNVSIWNAKQRNCHQTRFEVTDKSCDEAVLRKL